MKKLTAFARIIVGLLFIFSGFIKANDPLGFSYKLREYFEVFNFNWMLPLSLFLAIFICIFEIIVGFSILIGSKVKLTLLFLSLMMIFFTFLTFYSAYYNKVTSCGCFGDAIPLTPWQSFYKDVILCALTAILIIGRNNTKPMFNKFIENAALILFLIGVTLFPLYTSNYLPVIDFRPYKIGTNLYNSIPEHIRMKFYYTMKNKITSQIQEFEKYPSDSTWEYKSSRQEPINKSIHPTEHFEMQTIDGDDKRDSLITLKSYSFILVEYDLDHADRHCQSRINDFAQLCENDHISFVALTSSPFSLIKEFRKEVQDPVYKFYRSPDDVPLKAMIRSNPGLIMLKDSVVVAQWPFRSLPSYNDIKSKYFKK